MEWQPIETAPKDKLVLICGGQWESDIDNPEPARIPLVAFSNDGEVWYIAGGTYYSSWVTSPTHWTPLPPPPEVKQ